MIQASIIIPAYNAANRIPACLEALLAQKTAYNYEIIVVDDGSTDNTAEIVKQYDRVRLITQANAGPASARNHGVKVAAGAIVLFIDDDCIAAPDWSERMLAPFDDPELIGAKGAYLTKQKELIARFVQIEYEEKYDVLAKHQYIDFIDTYSAAFRRQEFLNAGGYDTHFSTASTEDQEFSFRLANMGHKMIFIPDAKVRHTHVSTISGYSRKKYKIGYWKVLTLIMNPDKISGDSHTPTTLKVQIMAIFLFLGAALFSIPFFMIIGIRIFAMLLLMGITAFLITTTPLTLRCFFRDPYVFPVAPLFIILRAAGLATGLAKGVLDRFILKRNN